MGWFTTGAVEEFLAVAGPFLRANPTSSALYQRLGYRPVEDRLVLSFAPAAPEPP